MTDLQAIVSAILGSGAGIAGAIKWGMGKIAKAQDRSIAALIKSAESNAVLATRLATLTTRFDWLVEILFGGGPAPITKDGKFIAAGVPTARDGKSDESQRVKGGKAKSRIPTPRPDSNGGG